MNTIKSRDGTTIALDRSGDGPAVILVAGALSQRTTAGPLAALLAARFTVISYDRRGRGDSGDTNPYAVDREVEDIAALVDEAGGSAGLFGHSSGAVLALEAAARGVAVTRLAMYEPPFIVDRSRTPVPENYVAQLNELVASGRRGNAVESFMIVATGARPDLVAEMRSSPWWPSLEAMAHTIPYDVTVMGDTMRGDPAALARFASVRMPALVMGGGASPAWARTAVQAIAAVLPDARRVALEGQAHAADPALVAPVLIEFFGSPTTARDDA